MNKKEKYVTWEQIKILLFIIFLIMISIWFWNYFPQHGCFEIRDIFNSSDSNDDIYVTVPCTTFQEGVYVSFFYLMVLFISTLSFIFLFFTIHDEGTQ